MQPAARLSVIVFAIFAVFVVLVLWKKSDRSQAITELEERFGAQLSITADEFYLGCSSPELKDLTELAELVLRVGKPQILDLTGAPALTSLKGAERLPSLTSIVAIDCPALASAEGVSGLPGLTQLHFTDSAGQPPPSVPRTIVVYGCTLERAFSRRRESCSSSALLRWPRHSR